MAGSVRRRVPALAVLTALIALELLAFYLLLNQGGWTYDDNLSLELAQQAGFHWHWLSSGLFGHFEIAHRAVFSLQTALMPLDYRWALVTMLALLGVAIYLFERCARMLLGNGWGPLVAAGYFGISVLLVPHLQWWSAGLEGLPTLVCDLACLWGFLRYQAHGSRGAIALSAGAMAVGLLFYEKPLYMPLYLILIRVLAMSPRPTLRALAAAVWRERQLWAAYAVVIVGYVVLRQAAGADAGVVSGSASLGTWAALFRVLWAQTLVPAVFGLTVPGFGHLSQIQVLGAIAMEVVVALAVLASLWRKRSAWRAWLALAACVLATTVLVGLERLTQFGAAAGSNPRYLLDFTWLVPLFVGLAFSRRTTFPAHAVDARAPLPAFPRLPVTMAAGALIAAYAATSIATAARLQDKWPGPAARAWERNVVTGLARLPRDQSGVVIADAEAPWYILQSTFAPYNRLSLLLPRYGGRVQVDGPLRRALYVIDDRGRVRPAKLSTSVNAAPLPPRGCLRSGSAAAAIEGPLRRTLDRGTGPYYLILTYWSAGSRRLPLYVDPGAGLPPSKDSVAVAAGAHQSIAWLGDSPPRRTIIDLPARRSACLRRLQLVRLEVAG